MQKKGLGNINMFSKLFSKHHRDSETLSNPTAIYFPQA